MPERDDPPVTTGYCTEPCSGCPWRKDTAMSIMRAEGEAVCGTPEQPVMPGGPMMPCHKKPTNGKDQNLCAGWLAQFGWHHIGVRFMVAAGTIPASALEPKPEWDLHPDVDSIIEAHGGGA